MLASGCILGLVRKNDLRSRSSAISLTPILAAQTPQLQKESSARIVSRFAAVALFVCASGILPNTPPTSDASVDLTYSRERALKEFDQTLDLVRHAINSDPASVGQLLAQRVVGPLPDDPRSLALCKEIIEKSSASLSGEYAVAAIRSILESAAVCINDHCVFLWPRSRIRNATDLLHEAGQSSDVNVQLAAAKLLAWMGGNYRQEAIAIFHHAISRTGHYDTPYQLIVPELGDSREVISYFGDVAENSTDTQRSRWAFRQIQSIATFHFANGKNRFHESRKQLISIMLRALKSRDDFIQLSAASSLPLLGRDYAKTSRSFLEARLRQPFVDIDSDAECRDIIFSTVTPLLESDRKEDLALLRDATETNDLLRRYEALARQVANSGTGTYRALQIAKWKRAIAQ